MDGQILAGNIANAKNPAEYHLVGEPISVEPIAIMVRKNDTIKKIGDQTIDAMAKSGALSKLYDKWFMQPIPPKGAKLNLPASPATKAQWANPNDKPVEDYQKK
jgi:glutamate/aspartate transport system substrate-binding protein